MSCSENHWSTAVVQNGATWENITALWAIICLILGKSCSPWTCVSKLFQDHWPKLCSNSDVNDAELHWGKFWWKTGAISLATGIPVWRLVILPALLHKRSFSLFHNLSFALKCVLGEFSNTLGFLTCRLKDLPSPPHAEFEKLSQTAKAVC